MAERLVRRTVVETEEVFAGAEAEEFAGLDQGEEDETDDDDDDDGQ